MDNRQMENRLRHAMESATPDIKQAIMADIASLPQNEAPIKTPMPKKRRPQSWVAAAACLLVCLGLFTGRIYTSANAIDSVISFDVNPSLLINVNKNDRVLSVVPLNSDAEIIIGGMDFKNTDLDVTVNALVGSMLANGYLDDLANSILISVENDDQEKSARLQQQLADEIDRLFSTGAFSGAIISQTVSPQDETASLAQQYGITVGKAQLISSLIEQNPLYTFEDMAHLSVNQLNLLLSSNRVEPENAVSRGTASDTAYIGSKAALAAALSRAALSESDVSRTEIELDFDDGVMIYEVEFTAKGTEYEVEIDALTGSVLKYQTEPLDDDHVTQPPQTQTPPVATGSRYIGAQRALDIAIAHSGAVSPTVEKAELDEDDGRLVYEIEFKKDGVEYEYEIDPYSGQVISSHFDRDDQDDINDDWDDQDDDWDDRDDDIDDDRDDRNDQKPDTDDRDDDWDDRDDIDDRDDDIDDDDNDDDIDDDNDDDDDDDDDR